MNWLLFFTSKCYRTHRRALALLPYYRANPTELLIDQTAKKEGIKWTK
ncbi:hypothetical protein ACFLXT_02645 [Chloroflexota bacterium]